MCLCVYDILLTSNRLWGCVCVHVLTGCGCVVCVDRMCVCWQDVCVLCAVCVDRMCVHVCVSVCCVRQSSKNRLYICICIYVSVSMYYLTPRAALLLAPLPCPGTPLCLPGWSRPKIEGRGRHKLFYHYGWTVKIAVCLTGNTAVRERKKINCREGK